jgi:hypothetical protein
MGRGRVDQRGLGRRAARGSAQRSRLGRIAPLCLCTTGPAPGRPAPASITPIASVKPSTAHLRDFGGMARSAMARRSRRSGRMGRGGVAVILYAIRTRQE